MLVLLATIQLGDKKPASNQQETNKKPTESQKANRETNREAHRETHIETNKNARKETDRETKREAHASPKCVFRLTCEPETRAQSSLQVRRSE